MPDGSALPALRLVPEPRAPGAPSSLPAAPPPPPPAAAGLLGRLREGKFPVRPRGGCSLPPPLRLAPGARCRPAPRSGDPRFQLPVRPPSGPGRRRARSRPLRHRAPSGPRGAPCVRSCPGGLPGGGPARPALPPETPSPGRRGRRGRRCAVAAGAPGGRAARTERRGQCALRLTKGSSSPARRPAGLPPASRARSRHRRAPRPPAPPRPRPPAAGWAGAGTRREARGAAGTGGGAGGNAAGLGARMQSPSLQPRSCRTHEQQVAADGGSSAPTCRARARAAQRGAAVRLGSRSRAAALRPGCAFCLPARGHTVT